jgi:hypothetical protein
MHEAMLWAIFSKNFFIPKQRAMTAKVTIQSKYFKATTFALIDSGATDNFISPYLVNRHKLPQYKLLRPRIVRNLNVDGSKNSITVASHLTHLSHSLYSLKSHTILRIPCWYAGHNPYLPHTAYPIHLRAANPMYLSSFERKKSQF